MFVSTFGSMKCDDKSMSVEVLRSHAYPTDFSVDELQAVLPGKVRSIDWQYHSLEVKESSTTLECGGLAPLFIIADQKFASTKKAAQGRRTPKTRYLDTV